MGEPALEATGIHVPRPKRYRDILTGRVSEFDGTPATPAELDQMLGLDQLDPREIPHFVLRITELMQPPRHFCPAGDWFYDIGPRAAQYRAIFAPAPLTFAISLRNPFAMLAQAAESGEYPGIDVIAPDPFTLRWAEVLRALRESCPDVPILAWAAEDAPMIWNRVLRSAMQRDIRISDAATLHVARSMMNEEGSARLADYLDSHPDMPDALRARVIGIFLKRFAPACRVTDVPGHPDWTEAASARIDAHYADDLDQVAQMDGVTLIRL